MIDMAGGNEFNLDETIKFLNDYNEDTKNSLSAIKQINLEHVNECTTNINKALKIIKANKDFRKKFLSTRNKDKSIITHSTLSNTVLEPMVKLNLGKEVIDTNTTTGKSHGTSGTVIDWKDLDQDEKTKITKKHFERVSRQADVLVYQYIYGQIQDIIRHESTTDLSKGFNFLTSLAKLTKRLKIVIEKAQKIQKGYQPNSAPSKTSNNVTEENKPVTSDIPSGSKNPMEKKNNMPPAPSPSGLKKPVAKTISVDEKSKKWETYDQNFKATYLVKTEMYRKFTDKKKADQKDYVYNESKFINAVKTARVTMYLEARESGWLSKDDIDINQLASHEINYGGTNQKLPCWRMIVQSGQENSTEMKELRKNLDRAGVKLAIAH